MSNENELKAVNENNSLDSAADILYLNADNSVFVESGDFVKAPPRTLPQRRRRILSQRRKIHPQRMIFFIFQECYFTERFLLPPRTVMFRFLIRK